MPLCLDVCQVCGRQKLETAAVINWLKSINHVELQNTPVNFHSWAVNHTRLFIIQLLPIGSEKYSSIPVGQSLYPQ